MQGGVERDSLAAAREHLDLAVQGVAAEEEVLHPRELHGLESERAPAGAAEHDDLGARGDGEARR